MMDSMVRVLHEDDYDAGSENPSNPQLGTVHGLHTIYVVLFATTHPLRVP